MNSCFVQLFFLVLIVSCSILTNAAMHNTIKSLPGFPGILPFHLETGYVGVGEMEEVQLFYYFVKSERNPERDPLFLWLTGGPGCSAFSGLVLEIGPLSLLNLNASNEESVTPCFKQNPFSWTKVASILFLDSPVGAGFSYATTHSGYYSGDTLQSWHIYEFLRKWLVEHSEFKDNPLYITGDSYSGKTLPIIVQHIINGNKADLVQKMNLKGFTIGNPYTRSEDHAISKFEFAERVSLISGELYESTKKSCNGTYNDDVDADCKSHLQAISDNLDPLFIGHVLEPKCSTPETKCRDTAYEILSTWANNAEVREALKIRQGTKIRWDRCNSTLAYTYNAGNTIGYHQNFTRELIRALVYSGDQDMLVPYVGTLDWIKNLRVKILDDWRPWFVNGQVAGYTMKYSNGHYDLTYATVKGAGHTAPEYKRQECLAMVTKWLLMDPF